MTIDITNVIEALLTILLFVLSYFVIPWLKAKIGEAEYAELLRWVEVGVEAAEQLFTEPKSGEKKKLYVLSFLEERGYFVDSVAINNMIEAMVLELKE